MFVVPDERGPLFEYRVRGRRCKHPLSGRVACRTCYRLDYACRHLYRTRVKAAFFWLSLVVRAEAIDRKRDADYWIALGGQWFKG